VRDPLFLRRRMKNNIFLKYTLAFLAIMILGFSLLSGYLFLETRSYFAREREESLERGAFSLQQSFSNMITLSMKNPNTLLERDRAVLRETILSEYRSSGLHILIADATETVILSTLSDVAGVSFSQETVALLNEAAKNRSAVSSTLQGILPQGCLVRAFLLETQINSFNRKDGTVILISDGRGMEYENALLQGFTVAAMMLIVVLLILFLVITANLLRPLRLLNEAATSFAGGDFSKRLSEEEGGEITPLIRAYNQMAEKVEKNESIHQTFISNVSHDLRTPLTTIGGFVQNMQSGAIPPEKQGHYFKIILDEVNRLSRLVQTLLETSRMTAGERKYTMASMDLCELGRITLLSFERRLEEKNLDVSFECEKENLWVTADRDAIQQVIYNLMDNAIKFTPQEGFLGVTVEIQGQKAIFRVKNSGEGIPEEELSHLFDRFYKSDRSRGLDKKGMGLGLFIVKSILSAHGEEVWVESLYGSYTEFFFSLPLAAGKKGERPEKAL